MHNFVGCLVAVHLAACFYGVSAQTGTDMKNLRTQLFTTNGYDNTVRPVANLSNPVEVNLILSILSLNELSEVTETLKTTGYLTVHWNDIYLQWNASDYGGIEDATWPQKDVWKPDISLKNSFLDYKELGVDTMMVSVVNDGSVWWYPFQVFQTTCSVDVTYFPFDTQTCQFRFVAWSYVSSEVTLTNNDSAVDLGTYEGNPNWDIISTSHEEKVESGTSVLAFSIEMKRKPQYIILSVILPILMLAVLNIFVFALPCDSGEKAGYAMTVFLSFAVFLTIVSSTLPESSETVAIFSIFLIIQTISSTVITLIALVMIRCNSFDESVPVPKCLQTVIRICTFQMCREKCRVGAVTPTKHECDPEVVSIDQMEETFGNNGKDKMRQNGDPNQQDYTWKEAINLLDVICFLFFFTVFILSVCVCFGVAANH